LQLCKNEKKKRSHVQKKEDIEKKYSNIKFTRKKLKQGNIVKATCGGFLEFFFLSSYNIKICFKI
jgi:hypothetical protein